ncbi:unnamed protein product [Lactuca saligna]|uniref:Uncharacterized protein n=1 Tax=Lactuca saligna TaxID=75948 RepID=A0AA35Y154_LACSI|nr:unnamed protein product [Lactuca saligna]
MHSPSRIERRITVDVSNGYHEMWIKTHFWGNVFTQLTLPLNKGIAIEMVSFRIAQRLWHSENKLFHSFDVISIVITLLPHQNSLILHAFMDLFCDHGTMDKIKTIIIAILKIILFI